MSASLATSLFVSLFMGLLCPGRSTDYYVKPSMESECPASKQPCKTLDEYAKNSQELSGDVRMIFLPGVHNLTINLTLYGLDTLQMIPLNSTMLSGVTYFSDEIQVKIQLLHCYVILDSISSLTLAKLIIHSAAMKHGLVLKRNTPGQKLLIDSTNLLGISLDLLQNGRSDKVNVTILNSTLERSSGTGIRVSDKRVSQENSSLVVNILNSNISYHQQGGIIVDTSATLNFTIRDSTIERNNVSSESGYSAAGLSIYSTKADTTRVTIQDTHFVNNEMESTHLGTNHDLSGVQSTVIYLSEIVVANITNCEFQDNRGTAIRAANIKDKLRLGGDITFHNNQAQSGGALALMLTQVEFMPGTNVIFEDNYANDVGGAIYVQSSSTMFYDVQDDPNTYSECFYQFSDWDLENEPYYANLTFINNSAKNGGNDIYGASLMSYCRVHEKIRSNDQDVQAQFHFNDKAGGSSISSNPSRVCVLDPATLDSLSIGDSCANTSLIFMPRSVYRGENINLSAVLTGAEFGTVTGVVNAQFLPVHTDFKPKLRLNQYIQRIDQQKASSSETPKLIYSVYSNHSHEILVLTASDVTPLGYGDKDEMNEAILAYHSSKVIPSNLLTTPVYINITLLDCPPGFYLNQGTMGCVCNHIICTNKIQGKCSDGTGLLPLGENLWVNAYNNGDISGVIVHHNCPFDYCKTNSDGVDLLNDPNAQCAMNHAGVLCGRCETGFSLAIGSNKCLPCSNNHNLVLLIFFIAAGFLLVFFIKILNLTVSQGTVNGLIFYANVIWAYQNIFFSGATVGKAWFLQIFIAWLNLDFGFEMCFVKDLTAYVKTWLQFVFPLYVWSIAGGMILLAHRSERMTRLLGNNSVQVLATLFLLSYAKLLRTIITALVPATLVVYTDAEQPVKLLTKVVWAFDGNLDYGRVPHVILLIMALLILIFLSLPYTFVLLFIQPLRASGHRCLKWINSRKPFFDAYVGPLNPSNHFWVGLLLLARFILLLTFSLTYASSPSASLLALIITVVVLLTILSYTGQLYDAPTIFNKRFFPKKISFCSILEVSFLLNLAIVGICVLHVDSTTGYTETKTAISNISVGIVFVQFIGIAFNHFWHVVRATLCSPRNHEAVSTTTTGSSIADSQDQHSISHVREPMLTESTTWYGN